MKVCRSGKKGDDGVFFADGSRFLIEEELGLSAAAERVLSQIENSVENFWHVPRTTGEFLFGLAVFLAGAVDFSAGDGAGISTKPGGDFNILEIGTSSGYSGIWLALALKRFAAGGRLYTIESHKERFEIARGNFISAGLEQCVVQLRGHAPEVFGRPEADVLPGEFDFVFIDATKMEYESYVDVVLPRVKRAGVAVFDNCVSHAAELEGFFGFMERLAARGIIESRLLPLDNGMLVCFKK